MMTLSCQRANNGTEVSTKVATTACGGCMAQSCISSCPNGAISYSNKILIDPLKCEGCGKCIANCADQNPRISLIDR
jgi:ferredoxin